MFVGRAVSVSAPRSSSVCRSFKTGSLVKVASPITVYHVPKFKTGIQLEGMTGTVIDNVQEYKGQELSTTQPWVVEFSKEADGKQVSFKCHFEVSRKWMDFPYFCMLLGGSSTASMLVMKICL